MDKHHCTVAEIAEAKLDPAAALAFVSDPGFGGITLFVGRVRDLNHGRDVTGISYDMFVPLALNGFAEIAARAEADFGGKLKLYIGHAKGRLGLGDLAMVVAARRHPAPRRGLPRLSAGGGGGQAHQPDLEAGALRRWRQRLERRLLAVRRG